jgi:hypothetical protein
LAAVVEPLRAEHVKISADLRSTQRTLAAADVDRRRAANEDAAALAAALRAGEKDRGPKAAAALEKELVEQQRRGNALFLARADIERDVTQLLASRSAEWLAEAEATIDAHRVDAAAALDALDAALAGLAKAKAVRAWITAPTRSVGLVIPKVPALRGTSGEPMHLAEVVAGVRALLEADPRPAFLDEHLGERVGVGDQIRDPEADGD